MTGITAELVKRGMSIYDCDKTEFESLWEYLTYKTVESTTGYVDEVI